MVMYKNVLKVKQFEFSSIFAEGNTEYNETMIPVVHKFESFLSTNWFVLEHAVNFCGVWLTGAHQPVLWMLYKAFSPFLQQASTALAISY